MLGELIRNPRPLRMADVGSHPYSYGFPVGHPPMGSFLGVPILVRGEPYGNLYLTEKQDAAEFTEEDEEAAILLADFAGVAIDHARRFTSSEAEREQAPADRRCAGRDDPDRASGRRRDRSGLHPVAGGQARPGARLGARAGDRAARRR